MYNWKVEEMRLINEKCNLYIGGKKTYSDISTYSRDEKIEFIDNMQNGKLSYILSVFENFNAEKESLPKENDCFKRVKTVSLKAWLKRNDTRNLFDTNYKYGNVSCLLGCTLNIQAQDRMEYNTFSDVIDELFYRQLKECERLEQSYFNSHDEYSILQREVIECMTNNRIWLGNNLSLHSSKGVMKNNTTLTIDELKFIKEKYEILYKLIAEMSIEIDNKLAE